MGFLENEFREVLKDNGAFDKDGVHSTFKSGKHGQKIDFEKLDPKSDGFRKWVELTTSFIGHTYDRQPDAVLGVANGTNFFSLKVAAKLGKGTLGLVSAKEEDVEGKPLYLPKSTEEKIANLKEGFVLVLEDVGTTGGSSAQVASQALAAGAGEVEVLTTWQRQPELPQLDKLFIPHRAIIDEALATYDPESAAGCDFCAQDWALNPRGE